MEYLTQFLASLQATKNLSPHTLAAYESDLNQFFARERDLFRPDLCAYVAYLHGERKLKDSSVRRKIVTLKLFYAFLCERELIAASPFGRLKFRFRQERRLPKTLSVAEVSRLLRCFDAPPRTPFSRALFLRDAALLDLLVSTGIRIGEAAAITLGDIVTSERTLLIHGKGRKQRLIYISSPVTWERLKALVRTRRGGGEAHLFLNRYGAPLSVHGIEDIYRKYARKAGLGGRSTPHYLRHTFATNLLANGADLRSVQEILGHASVSTTQIYTEVTVNRKKQVLKKYNYRNKL